MASLRDYVALAVNGDEISLYDVLSLAKLTGKLEFVQDAIDAALIRQAAEEGDLFVSDEELQQAADDFRAAHDLYDAEATKAWLAERHLTFADWESLIEDDLLRRKLRDALTSSKVEQHFAEDKLSFDSAVVSRLVVGDEGVARELRAQIVDDGADFHALARAYSIDPATKLAGGYAGELKRADMEAAIESAIFGAQPGKVGGPFKSEDGWHLIKVEALHPAALDDALRETIKSRLFDEWLAQRRRKAKVAIPLLEEMEQSGAGEESMTRSEE